MPLSRAQLALIAAVLAAVASSSPAVAGYEQQHPKNGGLRAGSIRGLQKGNAKGKAAPAPAPAPEPEPELEPEPEPEPAMEVIEEPEPEPAMEVMEEQPMAPPAETEPAAGASGAEKTNNGNKKADEETAPATSPATSPGKGGGGGGAGKGPDKDDDKVHPRGFKKGRVNDRNGNPPPKGFGDEIEKEVKQKQKEEQMADKRGIGSSGKTLKEEHLDKILEKDSMILSVVAPGRAKKDADAGPPVLTDMGDADAVVDEGAQPEKDEAIMEEEKEKWNNGKGKMVGGGGAGAGGAAVTVPEQDGEEKPAEEVLVPKPNADKRQNSTKVPKEPEQSPLPEGTVDPNADETAEEPKKAEQPKGPKERPVNENRYEPVPSAEEGGADGAEGEDPSAGGAGLIDDVGVALETDGAEPSPEEAADLVDPTLNGLSDGLNDVADVEEDPTEEEEATWIGNGKGKGNANGAKNGNGAEEQA